jgi:hypothetical protein
VLLRFAIRSYMVSTLYLGTDAPVPPDDDAA